MSFEIETMTKTKILDVEVLSQKNRQPDEEPGAKLQFSVKLSNEVLATFDGSLKSFFFTKNATTTSTKQASLEGVEVVSDMPNLSGIGSHVKAIKWDTELTGYRLEIDHGTGGKSNIVIDECVLAAFRIQPQEGGTVELKFNCESSNVSGAIWSKLAKLKSCDVDLTLTAPDVAQATIDDSPFAADPTKPKRKAKDATDVFVEQHGSAGL